MILIVWFQGATTVKELAEFEEKHMVRVRKPVNKWEVKDMQSYIIKQKMSNSGSIHDIASNMYDREIKFNGDTQYAVVLASYYGGKGYTTHCTQESACRMAHKRRGYSYEIIDTNGRMYVACNDQLVPD